MNKLVLIGGGGVAAVLTVVAARAQTPLPANQTTYGNFTVGNPGSVDGNLTVAGDVTVTGPQAPAAYYGTAGSLSVRGDLLFTGDNSWVLHSPNDGRKALYLAPGLTPTPGTTPNDIAWPKQTRFEANGDVAFSQKVSIGNVSCPPGLSCANTAVLTVGGPITAQGRITVINYGGAWPDYVFARGYRLRPLAELGRYVQAHHHLPDVPSAAQVQAHGLELVEMNATLLRKVEELTLYLLQVQAANQDLTERVAKLEAHH